MPHFAEWLAKEIQTFEAIVAAVPADFERGSLTALKQVQRKLDELTPTDTGSVT